MAEAKTIRTVAFVSAALCGWLVLGSEPVSAGQDVCISVNGDVKVRRGTATCSSEPTERGERPNIAIAQGAGANAVAGGEPVYPGDPDLCCDSGIRATARGQNASAVATFGSDIVAMATADGARIQVYDAGGVRAVASGEGSSIWIRDGGGTFTASGDRSSIGVFVGFGTATASGEESEAQLTVATGTVVAFGDRSFADAFGGNNLTVKALGDRTVARSDNGSNNTVIANTDGCAAVTPEDGGDNQTITC